MAIEDEIGARYAGPEDLPNDVHTAIAELSAILTPSMSECETHSTIVVEHFTADRSLAAAAVYLVACIAQSIEANLKVREALFNEATLERDLYQDVISVVGDSDLDEHTKTMVRNPWMWEALSHMLVHLSQANTDLHPSGTILAKTSVKYDVHDHGLDVIAIYGSTALGISAGECKAYFDDPSTGINHASSKLGEVDSAKRDIEIRAAVNQLRSALPTAKQKLLAGSFWTDERSYFPFVCCDEGHAIDWSRNRLAMRRLKVPVSRKILVPLSVPSAREVFDSICEGMRGYIAVE